MDAQAEEATSRWRLHLGWVDLTLGQRLGLLTPYFGLRAAGVRIKSRVNYIELGPHANEELSMKNKLWGVGPLMGIALKWPWVDWIGAYAKGATSFLMGSFYIHQDEEDRAAPTLRSKIKNQFDQSVGLWEAAAGLFLRRGIVEGRVGWQLYLFSGQNQAIQPTVTHVISNLGDLSLQGWTLSLLFEF